jgi:hypothetical protein
MTEDGYKYILMCQDNLGKYLIASPMLTQTAEEVTAFLRHIVLQYGIPQFIVTDQGSQFMSDMFKRLCKLLKLNLTLLPIIQKVMYLERAHKTMVDYLRCFCNPRANGWDK